MTNDRLIKIEIRPLTRLSNEFQNNKGQQYLLLLFAYLCSIKVSQIKHVINNDT